MKVTISIDTDEANSVQFNTNNLHAPTFAEIDKALNELAIILEPVDDMTNTDCNQALNANLAIRDKAIRQVHKIKDILRKG